MALKERAWLKKLQDNNNLRQCQDCEQYHAQNCTARDDEAARGNDTEETAGREHVTPRTMVPKPGSWLSAILRRKRSDADDVEASAESPNESTCLITPLTDDEMVPESSRHGDDVSEQNIEYQDDSEEVVKRKAKKGSKKSMKGNGKAKEKVAKDILDQVAAYEERLP
jgi:hypothetical protein